MKKTILIFVLTFTLTIGAGVGVLYFVKMHGSSDSDTAQLANEEQSNKVEPEIRKIEPEPSPEPEMAVEEPTDNSRYGRELANDEYCKEHHIYGKDAMYDDEISLLFAGDISMADGYANMETFKQRGEVIGEAFDDATLTLMSDADVFMVNNEFTYTRRGEPTPEKQFTFRADPDHVRHLDEMGVDIVSLANNHSYDYGEVSLLDTLDTLETAGMPYVGAGRNIDEAVKPTFFVVNDIKIGIVSATQIERLDNPDTKGATETSAGTFRCWTGDLIFDVIKETKAECDYVVAYIHWGTENEVNTDWAQDKLAPKLASAGADLIIGDHPHILQKLDYIDDTPVIYSLGNYWFNSKTLDTGLLEVTLDTQGRTNTVRFIPAVQSGCRTKAVLGDEKIRILDYMQSISPGVVIDQDGYVTKR